MVEKFIKTINDEFHQKKKAANIQVVDVLNIWLPRYILDHMARIVTKRVGGEEIDVVAILKWIQVELMLMVYQSKSLVKSKLMIIELRYFTF